LLPGRSTAQDNPCILLAGRHLIAVNSITLENLLVIEDGIYTPTLNASEEKMKKAYGSAPIPKLLAHFAKARERLESMMD